MNPEKVCYIQNSTYTGRDINNKSELQDRFVLTKESQECSMCMQYTGSPFVYTDIIYKYNCSLTTFVLLRYA